MARYSGKNLKVKVGTVFLDGVESMDIDETVGDTDLTAAGDVWETHEALQKAWTGSITLKDDRAVAANQTLRAGDSIDIEGYGEGDAVGKSYVSGSATVTSNGISVSYNGTAARKYALKGNGVLTEAVVSV